MVSSVSGKLLRFAHEYRLPPHIPEPNLNTPNKQLVLDTIQITHQMLKANSGGAERIAEQIKQDIKRNGFIGVSLLGLDRVLQEKYAKLQLEARIAFRELEKINLEWNSLIEEESSNGSKVSSGFLVSGRRHNEYCERFPPKVLISGHRIQELRSHITSELIDRVGELELLNTSIMKLVCKAYDLTKLSSFSWVESLGLNNPAKNPGLKTVFFKHPAIPEELLKSNGDGLTTEIIRNGPHRHLKGRIALVAPQDEGTFAFWNEHESAWQDLQETSSEVIVIWDGITQAPHYTKSKSGINRYLCTTFGSPMNLYEGLTTVQQAA